MQPTNMAEFFAVAGESFFDSPKRLRHDLPDVYEVLQKYFDINPVDFEKLNVLFDTPLQSNNIKTRFSFRLKNRTTVVFFKL